VGKFSSAVGTNGLLLADERKIVRLGERKPSARPTICGARPANFSRVNERGRRQT
jgi:hypothetical protein